MSNIPVEGNCLRNISVEFQNGRLLTKEMLQSLNEKIEYLLIKYENYHNGVISGFLLKEKDGNIILGKGILKLGGKIYFLENDINLQHIINEAGDIASGRMCTLVFRNSATKKVAESVYNDIVEIKVLCNETEKVEDTDIVVGIFEYISGNNIKLFFGCETPKEKLLNITGNKSGFNITEFKYALDGDETFQPIIFELMAQIILNKSKKNEFDYNLLSLIYAQKIVSKKIICLYIEMYGIDCKESTNQEIIRKFIMATDKMISVTKCPQDEKKIEDLQKTKKMGGRCI